MHIIYHFKAFEKGFQMNVNASRNISNTFQSTLKNSGDINWSIFVRMSVQPGHGNDYLPWLYTQPLQNIGGC